MAFAKSILCSGDADSYAEKLLASNPGEMFIRAYVYLPEELLANVDLQTAGYSNDFIQVWDSTRASFRQGVFMIWTGTEWQIGTEIGGSFTGEVSPNHFYKIDLRCDRTDSFCQLWVDDVDPNGEFAHSLGANDQLLDFGQGDEGTAVDVDVYVTGISVGTTRGGSDLFDGSVEDATFDAFDSTVGGVSIVDSPLEIGGPDPTDLYVGGISVRGGNEPIVNHPSE